MARKAKGHIFKRGRYYWVTYFVNGVRVQKSTGETAKPAARKWVDRETAAIVAGDTADKAAALAAKAAGARALAERAEAEAEARAEAKRPRLAISDAWPRYVASRKRRSCAAITLKDYGDRWRKFVQFMAAEFPAADMESVNADHATGFLTSLEAEGLSTNRRRKLVQTAKGVFHVLRAEIRENQPFADIISPRQITRSKRPLEAAEVRALFEAAEGDWRKLIAFGAMSGSRLHDACCLRWEMIDFQAALIRFIPAKTSRTGRFISVPLDPRLAAMLQETPSADRAGDVFPEIAEMYRARPDAISRKIRELFDAAGVSRENAGFHSLRHAFVNAAKNAGVSLPLIMEIVGHANPEVSRLYMHESAGAAMPAAVAAGNFLPAEKPAGRHDPEADRARLIELARTASPEAVAAALSKLL